MCVPDPGRDWAASKGDPLAGFISGKADTKDTPSPAPASPSDTAKKLLAAGQPANGSVVPPLPPDPTDPLVKKLKNDQGASDATL